MTGTGALGFQAWIAPPESHTWISPPLPRTEVTATASRPSRSRTTDQLSPPRVVKTAKGSELLPLVPADIISQHALGAAAIANPEAQSQILELQQLRGANSGLAGTLKAALRDVAPGRIETADPIADQAAGTTG